MNSGRYRTVAGRGEASLTVRGSQFLGTVEHVRDVSTAEALVDSIRADYPDATHVVPAYRIRANPFREFASDDGEPSGSAGKPILTVLQGQELENVIAVVVRYYGGTNLGIGGLVRAYQGAVKAAIEDAGVSERRPRSRLVIRSSYDDSGTIRGILEASDATLAADYEESVTFTVDAPVTAVPALTERLLDATSGRVDISEE